jgi:hypothetical protein
MADDDRTTDQFIREVDEELRRDQLKELWDRFGTLIIAVCVGVVAITAGYNGWVWWQEKQAAEAGDRYLAAQQLIDGEDTAKARQALEAIAGSGPGGYAMLARLRTAALAAQSGDTSTAMANFDAIADDSGADRTIRDLARLRAALIALDTGDLDGAESRVETLAEAGNPWRHAAREIHGTAAYARGDLDAARARFATIQSDVEAPADARSRAGAMLSLIDGRMPAGTVQ